MPLQEEEKRVMYRKSKMKSITIVYLLEAKDHQKAHLKL